MHFCVVQSIANEIGRERKGLKEREREKERHVLFNKIRFSPDGIKSDREWDGRLYRRVIRQYESLTRSITSQVHVRSNKRSAYFNQCECSARAECIYLRAKNIQFSFFKVWYFISCGVFIKGKKEIYCNQHETHHPQNLHSSLEKQLYFLDRLYM